MSKFSRMGLGVALVGLAAPFVIAGPVAAQTVGPDEVGAVSTTCIIDHNIDISTCADAVKEGLYEVVESENPGVDLGAPTGTEPGDFPYDINAIAVNPLPPLPPVIPVPSVPFQ